MRTALPVILVLLFLWMSWPVPGAAQQASPTPLAQPLTPGETQTPPPPTLPSPGISAPAAETTLRGLVTISGHAPAGWELAFGYRDDPTNTWFRLATSPDPLTGNFLTDWDTTLLTDGLYTLRLRVFAADAVQEYRVNIRIRNTTPEETPTPASTPTPTATPSQTPLPSATPTVTHTPAPPPTPLPPNPAELRPAHIGLYFGFGALGVIAAFGVFGLLLALSRKLRP